MEISERGEVEEEDTSEGDIGGDVDNVSDVTEVEGDEEEMPELEDASDEEASIETDALKVDRSVIAYPSSGWLHRGGFVRL